MNNRKSKKILLGLLPYWEPQIPPLGISTLKAFLQKEGYTVNTVDANIYDPFRQNRQAYFDILEAIVPKNKRGNFNNVGQDVFRNHLSAHFNYDKRKEDRSLYFHLVKNLVYNTFYQQIDDARIEKLTEVLDGFYSRLEEYFSGLLKENQPDVLGLSVYRGNLAPSMFIFKWVRQHYPTVKTVMGGAVFAGELAMGSPNLDYFLEQTPYIDTIIAGEGELLFLKYLQGQLPEGQRLFTINDIEGETLDVSKSSLADFSDLQLDYYPNMAVYGSRSCPFQCSFCTETVYWGKYRKKEPVQVVSEMEQLHQKHRSQLFLMCDSLLNPIISDLTQHLFDKNHSFYFDGYLRADPHVCDVNNTLAWRRGGFYRARLGIESGSPHVLELMGKKITLQQIKDAIGSLAEVGIKTTTYWVIGHPGETEADFQMTLDLIAELRDDIYEAWCSPFNFYLSGQVSSGHWQQKARLLYPEEAKKLLVTQTWVVDEEPHREEIYNRMNRFVDFCKEINVPNPYTMMDFYQADERWKKLHRNAVPSLVEFEDKSLFINENTAIEIIPKAEKKLEADMTFDF